MLAGWEKAAGLPGCCQWISIFFFSVPSIPQYTNRSWCKACPVYLSQSCISAAWHFFAYKKQKWIMWTSYGPTELHTPLYSFQRMLEWCARRRLRQEHTLGAVDGTGEENEVRGEGRKQGLDTFSARAHTHTFTRAQSLSPPFSYPPPPFCRHNPHGFRYYRVMNPLRICQGFMVIRSTVLESSLMFYLKVYFSTSASFGANYIKEHLSSRSLPHHSPSPELRSCTSTPALVH